MNLPRNRQIWRVVPNSLGVPLLAREWLWQGPAQLLLSKALNPCSRRNGDSLGDCKSLINKGLLAQRVNEKSIKATKIARDALGPGVLFGRNLNLPDYGTIGKDWEQFNWATGQLLASIRIGVESTDIAKQKLGIERESRNSCWADKEQIPHLLKKTTCPSAYRNSAQAISWPPGLPNSDYHYARDLVYHRLPTRQNLRRKVITCHQRNITLFALQSNIQRYSKSRLADDGPPGEGSKTRQNLRLRDRISLTIWMVKLLIFRRRYVERNTAKRGYAEISRAVLLDGRVLRWSLTSKSTKSILRKQSIWRKAWIVLVG